MAARNDDGGLSIWTVAASVGHLELKHRFVWLKRTKTII